MLKCFVAFFMLCLVQPSLAITSQQASNIGLVAIPIAGTIFPIIKQDKEGVFQLALGAVLIQATTLGLKKSIRSTRPNRQDQDSFPSRHASTTFGFSSFIHHRYGLRFGLPLYVASGLVGYHRIVSNHHRVRDVVAGGALGILGGYLTTKPYKNTTIAMALEPNYAGILYRRWFD